MTASSPDAAAAACPDCAAPLSTPDRCARCGLVLTGPAVDRVRRVDAELAELSGRWQALLTERAGLVRDLRTASGTAETPGAGAPGPGASGGAAPGPADPAPARREAEPRSVQNTLLGLGGLLLGIAATVFAAVTYDRLGAGGRAAVLLSLTLLAAAAVPVLLRRRLVASAETLTAVALVLAVLDAYGLRTLGVGDALVEADFWAAATGTLALLAAAYARAVPMRSAAGAAVLLAQLPPLLLAVEHAASFEALALVLALLAAADLLLAHLTGRRRHRPLGLRTARRTAAGCGALAAGLALLVVAAALAEDRPAPLAAVTLLVLAAVCGASAATGRLTSRLTAATVVLAALAAWATARPALELADEPLVAAACALLAVATSARLPLAARRGGVLGALLVVATGLAAVADPVAQALLGPGDSLLDPWSGASSARLAVGSTPWTGSWVTLAVLVAATVVVPAAGASLGRRLPARLVTAVLATLAVVVLPLALDVPYAVALVLLLSTAAALAATAVLRPAEQPLLLGLAAAVVLLAAVWSAADETATLAVLPSGSALVAATAWRTRSGARTAAAALGTLLVGVAVVAYGLSAGAAADQSGALLVAGVGASVALSALLRHRAPAARGGVEGGATVLAALTLVLTSDDPGWLSWSLAGLGLVALGAALQPDRRILGLVGAGLLAGSSWVRLAEAQVSAPEPYVVPLALVALALGGLRRRATPTTPSFTAYGPGLSALLLPSLLTALEDPGLTRPLLLGAAALLVLLVGARTRLRAPLALGSGVLAVDAVNLLLPYASALPRWLSLGLAGALLLGLGATYEQRRRDLAALRERYDALA